MACPPPRGQDSLGVCRSGRGADGYDRRHLLYCFDKGPSGLRLSVMWMPAVLVGPTVTDEQGDVAENNSFPYPDPVQSVRQIHLLKFCAAFFAFLGGHRRRFRVSLFPT